MRVQAAAKTKWNGESLTRIRTLTSIESVGGESGAIVRALSVPTKDNLTKLAFAAPPSELCVSIFRTLRNKMTPPFRLSVKGRVVDLQSPEMSQAGNAKRIFDIVDNAGTYITCCAMKHNVESSAFIASKRW